MMLSLLPEKEVVLKWKYKINKIKKKQEQESAVYKIKSSFSLIA
jgi:hypothetical protein